MGVVWALLLAAGCGSGGEASLVVDLRTDVVPELEFATVLTTVTREGARAPRTQESAAADGDFVTGARVADFDRLAPGRYAVRVTLLDGGGLPVIERTTALEVSGTTVLTVVISRACRGVVCPGRGDDPALTACFAGRCVDPRCSPEMPGFCGAAECRRDGDCVSGPSPAVGCADARCIGGTCLLEPHDERCGADERCHLDLGCTSTFACRACADASECGAARCAAFPDAASACVTACDPAAPACPTGFRCALDPATGHTEPLCLPVSGTCCIDADGDGFGQGVGCAGEDCDDGRADRRPGAAERCDGGDDDCDGTIDEAPTDCATGRCAPRPDGAFEAIHGGTCASGACSGGTVTRCGLYACGSAADCATWCVRDGADDDTLCVDGAHCEGGECVPDLPDGSACDEVSDCAGAHCSNGFCCASGPCCAEAGDCPGFPGPAAICEEPERCQGAFGEPECREHRCRAAGGTADDSACTSDVVALACAPYLDVRCTGTADQPPAACPTSCAGDDECVASAHCTGSLCIDDLPAGAACARDGECRDGLGCVDGVCCAGACGDLCRSCAVPGAAGECAPIPATLDPDGECPTLSCEGYYAGFGPGGGCRRRADAVEAAACDGAGACLDAATLCPLQPAGEVQIACNPTCQSPAPRTCEGTTPGECVDAPPGTQSCGVGACRRTTARCMGGRPVTCRPGSPTPEVCDGQDDDCDGDVDDGIPTVLGGIDWSCFRRWTGITAAGSRLTLYSEDSGPEDCGGTASFPVATIMLGGGVTATGSVDVSCRGRITGIIASGSTLSVLTDERDPEGCTGSRVAGTIALVGARATGGVDLGCVPLTGMTGAGDTLQLVAEESDPEGCRGSRSVGAIRLSCRP